MENSQIEEPDYFGDLDPWDEPEPEFEELPVIAVPDHLCYHKWAFAEVQPMPVINEVQTSTRAKKSA